MGMAGMWGRGAAREGPPERSTSEPAASGRTSRPALPPAYSSRSPASGYAILHGLARRTAPQTQPSQEPRKPLGGTRKPRRSGHSSGAIERFGSWIGPSWATHEALIRRVKSGVIFPYKKILTKMVNEHNSIIRCRILLNTVRKCQKRIKTYYKCVIRP